VNERHRTSTASVGVRWCSLAFAGVRCLRASRYSAKTGLCVTVSKLLGPASLSFGRAYSIPTSLNNRKIGAAVDLSIRPRPEGVLLRKEVIQPQVPLRLPCYDFIPVTAHTLGPCLLAVGTDTSGTSDSHDVTGGVYKARERIHGAVADAPLLAIPASCRRVAAYNPNWAQF
jgi:hypothetical protein